MRNPFKREKIGQIIHESKNIDLLRLNIAYHQSIGVDYFLICVRDAEASVLTEIQETFTDKNMFVFPLNLKGLKPEDEKIKNRRLIAYWKMQEVFNPSHIFFVDTDEFWIPKSGSIKKSVKAYPSDVLEVRRFNALLDEKDLDCLEEILLDNDRRNRLLIIHNPPVRYYQDMIRLNVPAILKREESKVFLRSKNYEAIATGFHFVSHDQEAVVPDEILVLHIPFPGLKAFEEKIKGIRSYFENIHDARLPNESRLWKDWASLPDQEAIEAEFKRQFFDTSEKEKLLSEKVICTLGSFYCK